MLLSSDRPFEAHSNDSSRLIWHPRIHEIYSRRLVFYWVKVRTLTLGDVEAAVTAIASSVNVSTFTCFSLIGDWDVLLRVWARPDKHEQLREALRDDVRIVDKIGEFLVSSSDFAWADYDKHLPPKDVEAHREPIETATKTPTEEVLRGLLNDRLVFALPRLPPERIVLFVSLSSETGTSYPVEMADELAERLAEQLGHRFFTIMAGQGYSEVLVRLSCAKFAEIADLLLQVISPLVRQYGGYSDTYLPALRPSIERDQLELSGTLDQSLTALATILGGDAEAQIVNLSAAEQGQLAAVMRGHSSELLSGKFEEVFLALFVAFLTADGSALDAALTVVNRLKSEFRGFVERNAVELAANDALVDLRLADLSQLESSELAVAADTVLGPGWADVLSEFSSLFGVPWTRDEIPRKEFMEKLKQNWSHYADVVCRTGRVYLALVNDRVVSEEQQ